MKLEFEVVPSVPGLTLMRMGEHFYTLTRAQAAALEAFCNCPELGPDDTISLAWGHRAGVEVARCYGETYTVLFTNGGEVGGPCVQKPIIRQMGRMLAEFRVKVGAN